MTTISDHREGWNHVDQGAILILQPFKSTVNIVDADFFLKLFALFNHKKPTKITHNSKTISCVPFIAFKKRN